MSLPTALLGLLAACTLLGGDSASGDTAACDRQPPLGYESFGQALLSKHCTGCHSSYLPEGSRFGAPVGIDFDTYQGVLSYAALILESAVYEQSMPPGGGLSDEELAQLEEWLVCGVLPDAERLAQARAGQ